MAQTKKANAHDAGAAAAWRSALIEFDQHLIATGKLPNTRRAYAEELARFALWAVRDQLRPIDADHRLVRRYATHLARSGSNGRPYAKSLTARKLSVLREFLGFLSTTGEDKRKDGSPAQRQAPSSAPSPASTDDQDNERDASHQDWLRAMYAQSHPRA